MNGVDDKQYVTIELHDAQLERLEALIERNLARQEAIAANMRADIAELKGDIKALDAKVDGVEKKMDARFEGVMDAIALTNTRIDDLQTKQSKSLTKWGIIIAVIVGVVQVITSIVLRYI
ncbi:MAG: hypothetical protein IJS39_13410 [Synergistaceae bacterium]|nr:hypothetical protein [Synergistaceae bacterium]